MVAILVRLYKLNSFLNASDIMDCVRSSSVNIRKTKYLQRLIPVTIRIRNGGYKRLKSKEVFPLHLPGDG